MNGYYLLIIACLLAAAVIGVLFIAAREKGKNLYDRNGFHYGTKLFYSQLVDDSSGISSTCILVYLAAASQNVL